MDEERLASLRSERASWPVHTGEPGERQPNPYADLTAEERVGMMWELTRTAWAFMGHPDLDPTLQKQITRVVRSNGTGDQPVPSPRQPEGNGTAERMAGAAWLEENLE